jgi:hypothetical protein
MTLAQHIDELDRMVANGAAVPELRNQIAFIGREAETLESRYAVLAMQYENLKTQTAQDIARFQQQHSQEVTALQKKHQELNTEHLRLKTAQGQPATPELDPVTQGILKFFFDAARDLTIQSLAQHFGLQYSVAEYHIDDLLKRKFIMQAKMGIQSYQGSSPATFEIASRGREFIVKTFRP